MSRIPLHSGLRLSGIAMLSCVLLLAGCHKQNNRAYHQPPPPDLDEESRPAARASAPAPAPSVAQPQIPPDALRGKPSVTEIGLASWYGPPYAGRKGADGTVYDQNAMTAANLTLPLGSVVRVTNLATDQSVIVRITDRGPFVRGRIIDLSLAAAKATGVYRAGVAKVRIEAYTPAPSPTSIPGGRWCVQIGAFYNPDDAIQLKNDLLRRYASAKVIEFQGPTGYWVRINPKFADKSSATEIADSIHIPDAEPYLTRTD
jgi:rare lipoprotein A